LRDDRALLADMLERIRLTDEFVAPGREAFAGSRLIQEAVIRNPEIIGEASRSLLERLRDQHPEVSWKQISAFRNFVIHVYWDIKLERIWSIVETDLPALRPQIEAILAGLDARHNSDPPPQG
jgi:uncharacterized protein with HEPN domain